MTQEIDLSSKSELSPFVLEFMRGIARADLVEARRYGGAYYHGDDARYKNKPAYPDHKGTLCKPCERGQDIALGSLHRAEDRLRHYGGKVNG